MFIFLLQLCYVSIKVKRNYLRESVTNDRIPILNLFFSESGFILVFSWCRTGTSGFQLEGTGLGVRCRGKELPPSLYMENRNRLDGEVTNDPDTGCAYFNVF